MANDQVSRSMENGGRGMTLREIMDAEDGGGLLPEAVNAIRDLLFVVEYHPRWDAAQKKAFTAATKRAEEVVRCYERS